MEYIGETGFGMQQRNAQHDAAIKSGDSRKSAVAWHSITHGHSFSPPVCIRRISSLPHRRFVEALLGRTCPSSKSINFECSASGIKDGDRSPGQLWNIDAGWLVLAYAKKIRSLVEKRLSGDTALPPSSPAPFIPYDSSLASFLPNVVAPPPAVGSSSGSPSLPTISLPPSHSVGDDVWILCSTPRGPRPYAGRVIYLSPLTVEFRNKAVESSISSCRVRPKSSRIAPPPWSTTSEKLPPLPSPPPPPPKKKRPNDGEVSSDSDPGPSRPLSKTACVDRCLHPKHDERWSAAQHSRLIRSQRFVDCDHGFCKFCCLIHCRDNHSTCRYHHHS